MAHDTFLACTALSFSNALNGTKVSVIGSPRSNGPSSNENTVAAKIDAAGTLSKMQVFVVSNAVAAATCSFTTRINLVSGNEAVTVSAAATGFLQDVTHTDSVAQGDRLSCLLANNGTGGQTIVTGVLGWDFSGTSTTAYMVFGSDSPSGVNINGGTASSTRFLPVIGGGDSSAGWFLTAESAAREYAVAAVTLSRLGAYVVTNVSANGGAWAFRKNAATGNQAVTFPANTTGYFEDTTHSDSVVAADLIDIQSTRGADTSNLLICFVVMTSSGTGADLRAGSTRTAGQLWGANYIPLPGCGIVVGVTTEANAQTAMPFGTIFSDLIATISVVGTGSAQSMVFRKNVANGNQAISLNPTVTGMVRDTTHQDAVVATDLVDMFLPAFTSAPSFSSYGLSITTAVNATVNLTGVHATAAARAVAAHHSSNITLGHAHATGAAHAIAPTHNATATLARAHATGIARQVPNLAGAFLAHTRATGRAGGVVYVNFTLTGVRAYSAALPIGVHAAPPIPYYPLFSIMRDMPVAISGPMSDDPVLGVGTLFPAACPPASLAKPLIGVRAMGRAATISPFFNVRCNLAGVSAVGRARAVLAIGNVI